MKSRLLSALCALSLLIPAALPAARAQVNLPALGDSVSEEFSVGMERRLGDQIMREIRRDPDYFDDPVLLEYLQSIWQPLMQAAKQRGDVAAESGDRFAWEAFLVRDRSVNAFALPGGFVGVHLGLIAVTASRDELASVLAHELSHVTQRHIARSIVNSKRQSMLGLAAMILGLLAASRSDSADGANAAIAGGQAAMLQGQLNFSRDMEREADRVGFALLSGAGFAPAGMASMFQKLENAYRLNDSSSFPYLRSHPLTSERIGEARARLGTGPHANPLPRAGEGTSSALEHAVMQARARVLMDPRAQVLQRVQQLDTNAAALSSPAERLAALAASALASGLLGDGARADKAVQAALALARSDPRAERALVMLQAQLWQERGDAARAQKALAPYSSDGSRAASMLRAQIALSPALNDGEALRRSAGEMQTRVALAPLDATAWTLLAQLQDRLGQPLRALRAHAEARYAIGDLSGAVDRLRAGLREGRRGGTDFVEVSVLEARLRDVDAERRALAAELRSAGRAPPEDR